MAKKKNKNANKYSYKGPKQEDILNKASQQKQTFLEESQVEDSLCGRGFNIRPVKDFKQNGQTYPPSLPIHDIYPNGDFPQGEILNHPLETNENRKTSAKSMEAESNWQTKLSDAREGAEIHKNVRNWVQRFVKPGMRLIDICELLENKNRQLIGIDPKDPLKRGIGFPTGVSLNNCAAHYTPNSNDNTILKQSDIMKVDFGTQINGRIIDCAFTMTFDEKYDQFINVVKEATNTGIREMGIDVRVCDVGAAINEVMSTDVEIGGKIYPMKPVQNLNGHNIGKYTIHSGKTVPLHDNGDHTKMDEGELFAIETFGTTGKGIVRDSPTLEVSHYMINQDVTSRNVRSMSSKKLLKFIDHNFGTLAFCRRWIDRGGLTNYLLGLKSLENEGIINAYPALEDKPGCYTAQYEHTIMLRPTCKEVVSRGFDF